MIIFSILGGILLFGAVLLFEDEFIHIVSISFTALILTELIMIAFTVRTWHCAMVVAEVISLGVYLISVMLFPGNFGKICSIHLILHLSPKFKPLVMYSKQDQKFIIIVFFRYELYDNVGFHMESACYHGGIMCSIIYHETNSQESGTQLLPKIDIIYRP